MHIGFVFPRHACPYRRKRAHTSGSARSAGQAGWRVSALLLAALAFAVGPIRVDAAATDGCEQTNNYALVKFQLPASISYPANPMPGTVLWTSVPTSATQLFALTCEGTPRSGLVNHIAGAPSGADDTVFPTYTAGIGYRIIRGDGGGPLRVYPGPNAPPASYSFDFPFTMQLVWTGPISSGAPFIGYELGNWNFSKNRGNTNGFPVVNFQATGSITVAPPACTVSTNPINVILPTMAAAALGGNGSTAGTTPFAIQLQCASGATLAITLATASPVTGSPGVLASTRGNGYATGVGVQLLDRGGIPVTLDQPATIGATPNGPLSIPYTARYFQTGTVTAGKINATATFTLTYQ